MKNFWAYSFGILGVIYFVLFVVKIVFNGQIDDFCMIFSMICWILYRIEKIENNMKN
jgi:hypothetical protein